MAADLGPGQHDLRAGGVVLLGDGLDGGVSDEQGQAEAVVAEGRVGGNVDALLLGVGDEGVVLVQSWVALDLVDGRHNTSGLGDLLEVLNGEVGDTNVLDLALRERDQRLPRVHQGDTVVERNLVLLLLVLGEKHLADGTLQGEGNGPVDEVEVKVVKLELGERVVEGLLDVLGAVGVVPQFGGDEDLLTLDAELLEALVQALGDLLLVLVNLGQVEVAVAGLQGLVDTGRHLAGLRLPRAITESTVKWEALVLVS